MKGGVGAKGPVCSTVCSGLLDGGVREKHCGNNEQSPTLYGVLCLRRSQDDVTGGRGKRWELVNISYNSSY